VVFLVREIIEKCGYSLFLRKPNGKLWEKVKSVVFTFSVNYKKVHARRWVHASLSVLTKILAICPLSIL